MVESSLELFPMSKVKGGKTGEKKILKTNPKPMVTLGRDIAGSVFYVVIEAADVFQQDLVQFNLSKPSYQLLAPNREKRISIMETVLPYGKRLISLYCIVNKEPNPVIIFQLLKCQRI